MLHVLWIVCTLTLGNWFIFVAWKMGTRVQGGVYAWMHVNGFIRKNGDFAFDLYGRHCDLIHFISFHFNTVLVYYLNVSIVLEVNGWRLMLRLNP